MSRVPELLVERLAAGELGPAEAADVRRRLAAEPGGLERLAALAASDAEILAALPPDRVAREVRARAAERSHRPPTRSWVRWAAPVVAVAAALLVVVAAPDVVDGGGEGAELRAKGDGGAKVFVHRRTADGDELLADGATAAAGDALQLGYAAAGHSHGVLLSVDGRGAVTLHHPPTPGGSTLLDRGGEVVLARAYKLDDAPSFEAFVLVVDDKPVDVHAVLQQVRDRGASAAIIGRDGRELPTARLTLQKVP
jgi:hypothetical protein